MALLRDVTSFAVHRLFFFFPLSSAAASFLILFAAACGQGAGNEPKDTPDATAGARPDTVVTMYASPT